MWSIFNKVSIGIEGHGWLNELDSWITKQLNLLIHAYRQYGMGLRQLCKLQKRVHSTRSNKW